LMLTADKKCPITPFTGGGDENSAFDLAELIMRGSILCQRCGSRRRERVCPKCGYDSCAIRISVDGKYVRIYHDKKGVALSFTEAFRSLSAINGEIDTEKKGGVKFDIRNWLLPEIEAMRFGKKYNEWLDYKRKKIERNQSNCRKATLKLYEVYRAHYQHLNELDVRHIKKGDIEKYFLHELPATLSQKYTRNMLLALKTFFRWLNDQERIEIPKFPEFRVTITEKQRSITYEEQMEAIQNFPEQHRDILFFQRETGLRVSEVCALQIRDCDIPSSRVLIQRTYSGYDLIETTKGNRGDWIPVSRFALGIASRASQDRFGKDFLFTNPSTGRGYKPSYLRRLWAEHGIKGLKLYEATRHSTITDWSKNASAFQVKDLARHSDIRTSQKYVHNAMTDLRDVVNRDNVISVRSDKNPIAENAP
jgi:integrase